MTGTAGPQAQPVATTLTSAAIFLVVTIDDGADAERATRELCGDMSGLLRAVGFRDGNARLSCVVGIGSDAWDRLFGDPRPAELHPFRELKAADRHAVVTPGDLLFHIRATRMDMCFELASQITARLAGSCSVVAEVHGFRYFDNRDLLGFVDGTENPTGDDAIAATVVDDDPEFDGGSYVIVQKYVHDLDAWNRLPTEQQERIIGRQKLSDIELADDVKPSSAHSALTSITDDNGEDIDIVRDNMPFGRVGVGEFGTYFIGYAKSPEPIERMLTNMFIGDPPGNYDRILDFSTARTGSLFFAPSVPLLDSLADRVPAAAVVADPVPPSPTGDGSLRIGSLKGA
ncbi:MAG TPA: Dyp-type peroxidase [Pseudonocardiaceae bacterium]|nr:Dyp-type peroxidase [Pseudonocardiaceae bacterium]